MTKRELTALKKSVSQLAYHRLFQITAGFSCTVQSGTECRFTKFVMKILCRNGLIGNFKQNYLDHTLRSENSFVLSYEEKHNVLVG
jgi:hypothetical protein